VSSYNRLVWVAYSGEVRGGVGNRSHVLCRKGGVGSAVFYSRLIYDNYIMLVEVICTCVLGL